MDVVVTVPMGKWEEWIREGDLPGDPWSGQHYLFSIGLRRPSIQLGERVYIVAHGRLRGFAPLKAVIEDPRQVKYGHLRGWALLRAGGAGAVTTTDKIQGFRGFRYRWWDRAVEVPFPDWRTP